MANCRQFEVIYRDTGGIDHLNFYSSGNAGSKKLEDDAKNALLRKFAELPLILSIEETRRRR